jgi:hypothetical protein
LEQGEKTKVGKGVGKVFNKVKTGQAKCKVHNTYQVTTEPLYFKRLQTRKMHKAKPRAEKETRRSTAIGRPTIHNITSLPKWIVQCACMP